MQPQLKGKKHIKYIQQLANSIWERTGFMDGQFTPSLHIALRKHRESLLKDKICSYSTCSVCKKILDQGEVYYFFSFCWGCWNKRQTVTPDFQMN